MVQIPNFWCLKSSTNIWPCFRNIYSVPKVIKIYSEGTKGSKPAKMGQFFTLQKIKIAFSQKFPKVWFDSFFLWLPTYETFHISLTKFLIQDRCDGRDARVACIYFNDQRSQILNVFVESLWARLGIFKANLKEHWSLNPPGQWADIDIGPWCPTLVSRSSLSGCVTLTETALTLKERSQATATGSGARPDTRGDAELKAFQGGSQDWEASENFYILSWSSFGFQERESVGERRAWSGQTIWPRASGWSEENTQSCYIGN